MIIDDQTSATQPNTFPAHPAQTNSSQTKTITVSLWDQLSPRLAFRFGIISALGVISALGLVSVLFLVYKNYL